MDEETGESVDSPTRISKHSWLEYDANSMLTTIQKRFEALTGAFKNITF